MTDTDMVFAGSPFRWVFGSVGICSADSVRLALLSSPKTTLSFSAVPDLFFFQIRPEPGPEPDLKRSYKYN